MAPPVRPARSASLWPSAPFVLLFLFFIVAMNGWLLTSERVGKQYLRSALADIKSQLASKVHLPAGTTIEYGGLYQEQQSSFRELLVALGLAIALVFLVLVVEFRSFAHPAAIVAGAVLALSGSLAALLITRNRSGAPPTAAFLARSPQDFERLVAPVEISAFPPETFFTVGDGHVSDGLFAGPG